MLKERTRRPSHPGAVLAEILPESGLNQTELAKLMGVSRRLVNEIINERRNVTPDVAHRLAAVFNTTPDLWLGLQTDVDIWDTADRNRKHYSTIRSKVAQRANTPAITPPR
jgi:addiction module HigA family antidote